MKRDGLKRDGFKRDGLKRDGYKRDWLEIGGYISRLLFNRLILVNLERISRKMFQHLVKSDSESKFSDKDLVSI